HRSRCSSHERNHDDCEPASELKCLVEPEGDAYGCRDEQNGFGDLHDASPMFWDMPYCEGDLCCITDADRHRKKWHRSRFQIPVASRADLLLFTVIISINRGGRPSMFIERVQLIDQTIDHIQTLAAHFEDEIGIVRADAAALSPEARRCKEA